MAKTKKLTNSVVGNPHDAEENQRSAVMVTDARIANEAAKVLSVDAVPDAMKAYASSLGTDPKAHAKIEPKLEAHATAFFVSYAKEHPDTAKKDEQPSDQEMRRIYDT